MRKYSRHAEWLNLIEKSGPFLVPSVLESAFPQGLEAVDPSKRRMVRNAFHEWVEAINDDDPLLSKLHDEWIRLILYEVLEFDDQSLLKSEEENRKYSVQSPVGNESFLPNFTVISPTTKELKLLISIQPPGTNLERTNKGSGWPVSLMDRMTQLCRKHKVRLGLLTNGAQWMIVNAPVGETSSNTSWFSRLWFQEPLTFQAFESLLGVRRFFGPEEETLEALLQKSTEQQEEITDTLGEQVRRAVEVLTQCLDKVDADRNRDLLRDVLPNELYEAGLTVMMRLVFTMCAEERGLLHLDDPTYEANYAVSSLRNQLEEEADRHGVEVLERRHDAWARLLAICRAIYGGIEHENLRLPALGGSLFDPDRFPFLEGRAKGTNWTETPSQPLPIDNRTVLLLLSALQVLEQPGGALLLSYKALDVEQIGHVYEGLLEHTVERLQTTTLGLIGSKKAKYPNLSLSELESLSKVGMEVLSSRIKEVTLRSPSAIQRGLEGDVNEDTYSKLLAVCGGDALLADRIRPFALLLRSDAWGEFIIYQKDSFAVTLGSDRRETGTHYTPKSFTESIVERTLEPIVYHGPAEGKPQADWLLKSSQELLELRICDPAMGSGAFLVQVCRWLSEMVVRAWRNETLAGKFISIDGQILDHIGDIELMPESVDDQLVIARQLVAERCLYGVDLNPLAVELAKLSIWLITMSKGRPFGFLDHNLRSGDSLLGIHKLEQLYCFNLHADDKTPKKLFAQNLDEQIRGVISLRKKVRDTSIRDIRDIAHMGKMDVEARQKLARINHIADAIIDETLISLGKRQSPEIGMDNLSTWATNYLSGKGQSGGKKIVQTEESDSSSMSSERLLHKPFHWALEFPEVFEAGGFDGIVGNPPYHHGSRISSVFGKPYLYYLLYTVTDSLGKADLCSYFTRRAFELLRRDHTFGLVLTNSIAEGENLKATIIPIVNEQGSIYAAETDIKWPGSAAVFVTQLHVIKGLFLGKLLLNKVGVEKISTRLSNENSLEPKELKQNSSLCFKGSELLGNFYLSDKEARSLIQENESHRQVVRGFLGGKNFTSSVEINPDRWVIFFNDWSLEYCKRHFPGLLDILEQRFFGQNGTPPKRKKWWQFHRHRSVIYKTISKLQRVLLRPYTSNMCWFEFGSNSWVLSNALVVVLSDEYSMWGILNSSIHEEHTYKYATRMKTDLRYTPTSCFGYFALPELSSELTNISKIYHSNRMSVREKLKLNLRDSYQMFHNPNDPSREFQKLRNLHCELDLAVAKAYGWEDINLGHDFHKTTQGLRFTISEEARSEILQRLLMLNHASHEEEVKQGLHSNHKNSKKAQTKAVKQTTDPTQTTFLKNK